MPKTISRQTAQLQLEQALSQREQIQNQLTAVESELSRHSTGSDAWMEAVELARQLRSQIDALSPKISQLTEDAKSEAQKQREIEAAQKVKALNEQSDRDLESVMAIVNRVNTASDELSEAMFDFYRIPRDVVERLQRTGKLQVNFSRGTSADFLIGQAPAILNNGSVVRPLHRRELLKVENPKHPNSKPRKAMEQ